jgi:hypothetical protein
MALPTPRPALDRAALERVLARAAELQTQGSTETGSTLSDEQILDLGKEVGLSPESIRQAIAEERGRVVVPESKGATGAWFGAGVMSAARVVPGTPTAVLAALDNVLRGELPFDVSRRFADRMQWAPKRGFLDMMRSQLARPAEGMDLKFAEEVSASVMALDAQRTHVRLDAMLLEVRSQATSRSVALVAGATALGLVGIVLGFAAIVVAPVAGAITAVGLLTTRDRYRRSAVRVGTALEQLLDRLEFGPARRKDGIIDKLLG